MIRYLEFRNIKKGHGKIILKKNGACLDVCLSIKFQVTRIASVAIVGTVADSSSMNYLAATAVEAGNLMVEKVASLISIYLCNTHGRILLHSLQDENRVLSL